MWLWIPSWGFTCGKLGQISGVSSPIFTTLLNTMMKGLFIGISFSSVRTDKLIFGSGTTLTVEPSKYHYFISKNYVKIKVGEDKGI